MYLVGLKFWKASIFFDEGVTNIGPDAEISEKILFLNKLGLGFVLIRKPGKLPRKTISEDYALEYGTNTLCVHEDSFKPGDKVFIVDDLLATGGTALASARLVERSGATVAGMGFLIDLVDLKGKEVLKDYNVLALMEYEGE
jgi:adenine phosphoribosyltransferase